MIGWRKHWKYLKPWKGVPLSSLSCLSVPELQKTRFDLGTKFLDWKILGTWERNTFFGFVSKFWNLTFLGLFFMFFPFLISLSLYLFVRSHIIWITVFGLFNWYHFSYRFRLKWLMLIDIIYFMGSNLKHNFSLNVTSLYYIY